MCRFAARIVLIVFIATTFPYDFASAANGAVAEQKGTQGSKATKSQNKIVQTKRITQNESNEEKALAILLKRKDVVAWLKEFDGPDDKSPKTGGHAVWRFNGHDKNVYTIQGVEVMDDHDVTFGWYHVNISTGVVTKDN